MTIWYAFHTNFEQILYNDKKNIEKIQFVNLIYYWQPPIDSIVSHLLYINKFVQKHNENVFTHTSSPTFFSKQMTLSTHHAHHPTNFQMI